MKFSTERELVDAFAFAVFPRRNSAWEWLREFNTSSGVADLLAVKLVSQRERTFSVSQIPARWAYALRQLPSKSAFTIEFFAGLTNVSETTARGILRTFYQLGFCVEAEEARTWKKLIELEPIVDQIIAIEAKLNNWRRALYQAAQHIDYATQSWVVLDLSEISSAGFQREEFERRSVGLAGISRAGEIEVIFEAPKCTPRIPFRFWQANVEIAKRLA